VLLNLSPPQRVNLSKFPHLTAVSLNNFATAMPAWHICAMSQCGNYLANPPYDAAIAQIQKSRVYTKIRSYNRANM
jgi:hypothetical protein